MKDLTIKEGWLNRHIVPLPEAPAKIIFYDNFCRAEEGEEQEVLCEWHPHDVFDSARRCGKQPAEGYLGTARKLNSPYKGIGFHAWEQNNSEFVHYKLII
jgi:hypothetical protein